MAEGAINRGVYDVTEVARYLACSPDLVVEWANPTSDGLPPVVSPSLGWAFSFEDLIGLRVARLLRKRGVPLRGLRRSVKVLAERFETDHPLAESRVLEALATSGNSLVIEVDDIQVDIAHGEHGVFKEVAAVYLRNVAFDDGGTASRWSPAPGVLIDPRIQAGAPCVEGTRVTTSALADLVEDAPFDDVADDYDLDVAQVRSAVAFERSLNEGNPLPLAA